MTDIQASYETRLDPETRRAIIDLKRQIRDLEVRLVAAETAIEALTP